MGEAKRRKELGIPARKEERNNNESKNGSINKLMKRYPYLPFIIVFSLVSVLIIDLINYYK